MKSMMMFSCTSCNDARLVTFILPLSTPKVVLDAIQDIPVSPDLIANGSRVT